MTLYLSEKTKQQLQKLKDISKEFVVNKNWYDFKQYEGKVSFQVMPYQAPNGIWGVVYTEDWFSTFTYYSASIDPTNERDSVNKEKAVWGGRGIWGDTTSNNQSPKINDKNIDFSEAYANLAVDKLIERQYIYYIENKASKGVGWDNLNVSKSTVDAYQKGDFQTLKTAEKTNLDNLSKRPDITQDDYQTLLKNQCKHTKADLKPADYDQIKGDLGKWIETFGTEKTPTDLKTEREAAKEENKKLKEQLATKEVEAAQSNEAYLEIIKSYQELINPWLEELKSKVKSEPLTQELLSIYRKEMDYRLTLFYQEREIDDKIINEKYTQQYGQSYETILKEKLTLTNREEMEKAFKVVTCICAYEKADQMSKEKDKVTSSEALLNRLDKLEKTWSPLLSLNVKSENNPFYLPLIENQSQYYGKLKELIATWKQNQLQSQQLQAGK